jgi:hypothetical protein
MLQYKIRLLNGVDVYNQHNIDLKTAKDIALSYSRDFGCEVLVIQECNEVNLLTLAQTKVAALYKNGKIVYQDSGS